MNKMDKKSPIKTSTPTECHTDGTTYSARTRYCNREIASRYDRKRFHNLPGKIRNRQTLRVISKALSFVEPISLVLDAPCGTGRIISILHEKKFRVVGADISLEMMEQAVSKLGEQVKLFRLFQGDLENIPCKSNSFDCILNIRFMHLVPPAVRLKVLREISRVTKKWAIVMFYHRYNFRYVRHQLKKITRQRIDKYDYDRRISKGQLLRETQQCNLKLIAIFPVARIFSEKWIVVLRKETV